MKTLPTLLMTFLLTAQTAFSANYYLDSQSGNDKNKGFSAAKAWKTLERANKTSLRPGDTLFIRNGTSYQGQLAPAGSGAPGKPVVVATYGTGNRPCINAKGLFQATLLLYNREYITVSGLELTNQGTERTARRSGVLIQAQDSGILHNICVKDLYIHDVNGSLVKKQGGGQGIEIRNAGRKVQSAFDGLLIEQCHIVRTERNGIIFNSDYWSRDKWFPNKGVVVRKCLLEEVPGDGIVPLGCVGALVEHNVMRNCTRLLPPGEAAAGIWPWSSDYTVIQYNEVSDHKAPWDAQGFDCDYNCKGTVIQYNYSHDNEGGFLLVCSPSDQRLPWSVGNDSSVVRFNLSVNDGFRLTGEHKGFSPSVLVTGPVSNTLIYGNTFIVPAKPEGADKNLIKMDTWGGKWPVNTTFSHNIFQVSDSASVSLGKDSGTVFKENTCIGKIGNAPDKAGLLNQ